MGRKACVEQASNNSVVTCKRWEKPGLLPFLIASTILGAASLYVPAIGHAQQQPAAQSINFNIPSQPLSSAINAFIRATGWEVGFNSPTVVGKRSAAISGSMAPAQALQKLLAGTGLNVQISGPSTAALVAGTVGGTETAVADGSLMLETVTVRGANPNSTFQLADPYAGGQVATGGQLGILGNKGVMDTPFNVANYTSKLIEDQQADSLQGVLKNEASVRRTQAAGGGSAGTFLIRGFSVNTNSVTVGGLYGMAPNWGDFPTDFVERVEVLKGPNALLNGMAPEGLVGGGVNIVLKRADDAPLTRVTTSVESDALLKSHVDIGRRFGANGEFGVRFNGSLSDGDGYIDGQEKAGHTGALALDYRGDRLRLTLDAFRFQQRMQGGVPPAVSGITGIPSMPAAPDGRTNILPGAPLTEETTEAVIFGGEFDFNERWTGYAKLGTARYDMSPGFWAANITNLQPNGDGNLTPVLWTTGNHTEISGETGLRGRFETGTISHALTISASHLVRDDRNSRTFGTAQTTNIYDPAPIVGWPAGPSHVAPGSETTLDSLALNDTLGFMDDRILLNLGLRRQNVQVENFDTSTGAVTSTYDEHAWSPMVGLVVKPTDNLSLYANYIQGLSAGTTVSAAYQNAGEVFPPYKTKQIEIGAKLETGSFTNTLSVFQIEKPGTLVDNSTTPLPTLRLDGEQRNRGVEWTIFGELTPGLRVLGGVTYLQPKLTRTQNGLLDGNLAGGMPTLTANLGAEWDMPSVPGLAVSGRLSYTSSLNIDNANTVKLPSWTLLDLGARYTTEISGKPVAFRANVDNVFNEKFWVGGYYTGYAALGAPRTFKLSATVDF